MLQPVIEYFKEKEWAYANKKSAITFALNGKNGVFHCVLKIFEEDSFISFITYMGVNCPDNKRYEMAELLTHINSNLLYGNFEMNLYDGEIKFRTGAYYEGVELNSKFIDNIIMKNIYAIDVSSVELSKFIYGNVSIPEVYDILYPRPLKTIEEPEESKQIEIKAKEVKAKKITDTKDKSGK